MRRLPAGAEVPEHPVIAISINGAHVEINGTPLNHDNAADPYQEAVQAVARTYAQELDRPVRAFASDSVSARRMIIHPNGRVTDIEPYALPGAATASPGKRPSAPAPVLETTGQAETRRRRVLMAAVPTAFVVIGGLVAADVMSGPARAGLQVLSSAPSAVSASASAATRAAEPSRDTTQAPQLSIEPGSTLTPKLALTGVGKGGIGQVRLQVGTTAAGPVDVLVMLAQADRTAWRRTVSVPPSGRILSISDLEAGTYAWSARTPDGTAMAKGTVVVRAEEPTSTPTASPEPGGPGPTTSAAAPGPTRAPSPAPNPTPSVTEPPPSDPYQTTPPPTDPY